MAIPGFQDIMLPLLKLTGDGEVHNLREACEFLAEELKLTREERKETLRSRPRPKFNHRVGWARTYLEQAGLLESTRQAHFRITERGTEVLSDPPERLDARFLKKYSEFIEFQQRIGNRRSGVEDAPTDAAEGEKPLSETQDGLTVSIPNFWTIMLPLLKFAKDDEEHHIREAYDAMAKEFGLTEEERAEMVPSGNAPLFNNRVGWARTYMAQAGLLESTRWAHFRITERGKEVLSNPPNGIDASFLRKYEEFVDFQEPKGTRRTSSNTSPQILSTDLSVEQTPDVRIESAYQAHRSGIEYQLLEQLRNCTSDFFENLVLILLDKMGYSGLDGEVQQTGGPGDGGIDGIIFQDKLRLDAIYIQAKQQKDTVGRPDIQKFVGALKGRGSEKGIFVTTSTFSKEAEDYAELISVVLVGGKQLAELMFDYDVGVSTKNKIYEIKEIDSDFFDPD